MKNGRDIQELRKLPAKDTLFLGGHQNLTKKLRQLFPKWQFISDDRLRIRPKCTTKIVFFWSAHASHKLSKSVLGQMAQDVIVIYVTSTNLDMLICEMESKLMAAA